MDTITGFAVRDAQSADAPALTQIVRSSGAYDGTHRVMVASQLIDPTYLARNPTRVCVDDRDAIVGFASLLVPGRGVAGEAELDYMFVADDRQGRGVGRALMARQVPSARHLAVLNRRIGDWAAARPKVHLLALDRLMIDLRERRAIEIGARRVPAGQALLQRDQLHPTPQGLAVLAALVLDALGRAPDAGPSPWLDVEELSARVQQAAAERQERTRRQREERRERRRSYRQ